MSLDEQRRQQERIEKNKADWLKPEFLKAKRTELKERLAQTPDGGDEEWRHADSSADDMWSSLGRAAPPWENGLVPFCERTLERFRGSAILVEPGGIASKLAKSFPAGFLARSLGISIHDYRGAQVRADDATRDHQVIEQDLHEPGTAKYKKVDKWLAGKKAHLIIQRLLGGWEYGPPNATVIFDFLDEWYRRLEEGGLMFMEIPTFGDDVMPQIQSEAIKLITLWRKKMQAFEQVDLWFSRPHYSRFSMDPSYRYDIPGQELIICMHKKQGAPKMLPRLTEEEIKRVLEKKA